MNEDKYKDDESDTNDNNKKDSDEKEDYNDDNDDNDDLENNIKDSHGGNFLKMGDVKDLMDCKFLLRSFDIIS